MKRMSLVVLCVFVMASICYAENIDVFWLADKGTPQQLQEAVEHGAKFNVKRNIYDFGDDDDIDLNGWLFDHGETPLHRAATYNRNPESIRFLISQGLDVNAEASMGNTSTETPLICAVRKNTVEVIRELLKGGANPNHESTENIFKIVADERGKDISTYKAIVEALVEAGGNVNAHWEVKPEERTPILLPRSQWKSSNPMDNMRDDFSNAERANFRASFTPLMFAVFDDNPDIVNILLDVNANANIRNAENKCALDYANDLPADAKLKHSPVFERLRAATETSAAKPAMAKNESLQDENSKGEKKLGAKTTSLFSAAQLEKLVNEGKVPAYVGDKGEFSYNPDLSSILMTGDGVRLRSQPNTKANVVDQLDKIMWGSIDYLGTWTHPDGSKWNIGLYDDWGYYPEDTPEDEKKVVFVSAQFSNAVSNKEYRDYMATNQIGGADAGWDDEQDVPIHREIKGKTPLLEPIHCIDGHRIFKCKACGTVWNESLVNSGLMLSMEHPTYILTKLEMMRASFEALSLAEEEKFIKEWNERIKKYNELVVRFGLDGKSIPQITCKKGGKCKMVRIN